MLTPVSSETSAVFLSSVLHAVIDYSKALLENILFIHELVVWKRMRCFPGGKIVLAVINYIKLACWFKIAIYPSVIETTTLFCSCYKITTLRLHFLITLVNWAAWEQGISQHVAPFFHSCHAVSLSVIFLYPFLNLSLWTWLRSSIKGVKSQKDHKTEHQIPESTQNI